MKRISAKLFFTVLWRGMCQAFGWFFGLFGYKRGGKYVKGLLVTGVAVIVGVVSIIALYSVGREVYHWCDKKWGYCNDPDCDANRYVFRDIYFHDHGDGKGYVWNMHTGEKLLKHVAWTAAPEDIDSLVCFSDGEKRGYFSKLTGKVIVEPKYDRAWIFSDGMACVEENGYVKFIDGTGKVIIDIKMTYNAIHGGYFFHNGYCIVPNADCSLYGLMDKNGRMVLPQVYSDIHLDEENVDLWLAKKDDVSEIYDKDMNLVLMMTKGSVYITDGTINVVMPDHTISKYDLNGELIDDFYVTEVRSLEYEKDEVLYHCVTQDANGDEYAVPYVSAYRPMAVARLRAYVAGEGYEGLMTADGHIVTMPLYDDIRAIGPDLYLCTISYYDGVIVNGNGEVVR